MPSLYDDLTGMILYDSKASCLMKQDNFFDITLKVIIIKWWFQKFYFDFLFNKLFSLWFLGTLGQNWLLTTQYYSIAFEIEQYDRNVIFILINYEKYVILYTTLNYSTNSLVAHHTH